MKRCGRLRGVLDFEFSGIYRIDIIVKVSIVDKQNVSIYLNVELNATGRNVSSHIKSFQ